MIGNKLTIIKIKLSILFWKVFDVLIINPNKKKFNVLFVVERADWAIKYIGINISKRINKNYENFIKLTTIPEKYSDTIIHFGSHYMWLSKYKYLTNNNKYVVSFYHGNPDLDNIEKKIFNEFLKSVYKLKKIIVSNSIVKNRLLKNGVPKEKIILIPIGVDTKYFKPPTKLERRKAKAFFNFKEDEIIIGSFQKDGKGWGRGLVPKLIKGPDIFVNVIEKLSKYFKIKILLTGPARGFIKQKLYSKNIYFIHHYLTDYSNLLKYYHALDFYLITSREEGGPMGLLESMSSGVPVISTKVGMAPDLIKLNQSGLIVDSFEPSVISKKFKKMIISKKLDKIKSLARKSAKKVDWDIVANKHLKKVYTKF